VIYLCISEITIDEDRLKAHAKIREGEVDGAKDNAAWSWSQIDSTKIVTRVIVTNSGEFQFHKQLFYIHRLLIGFWAIIEMPINMVFGDVLFNSPVVAPILPHKIVIMFIYRRY
jgi:hypothetical protein